MIDLAYKGHVAILKMHHGKANAMDAALCDGVGRDLDPQVVAAARRELEVPSHGNRPGPGILGTAAAEDAPREVEGNVTTAGLEMLRERTRGADGGRGRPPPGRSTGAPESGRHARDGGQADTEPTLR